MTVTVTAAADGAQTQSLDPNAPGDYTVPVTINVTNVDETPTGTTTPEALTFGTATITNKIYTRIRR